MAEHCRECRAMRNLGSCDCAELLSRRPIVDSVAKPLLRSALGERWMGMDDVTRQDAAMSEISEADARPRLRSLWRERAPLERKVADMDQDLKQAREQLQKVNGQIDDEERYLKQKNASG
jgi:hypothetical protein